MQKFNQLFIQPAIYGLALAFVTLLFFPELIGKQSIFTNGQTPQQPPPLSYANAVRKAAPAVVNIYSLSIVTTPRFLRSKPVPRRELGSGIIMSSDGFILTNHHVVDNADQIEVVLQDGRIMRAELIGKDMATDLALLKVDAQGLPVIDQDPNFTPQVGDVVLALGNPLNLGLAITHGIISAKEKRLSDTSYVSLLQMDAAINAGNSGGAVVNSNGLLIGISTSAFQTQYNDIQGIFFAVPYKTAVKVMDKLVRYGRFIRGYLGVNGQPISAEGKEIYSNTEVVAGIRLTGVEAYGPAYKAGLRPGDVIFKIDETPIVSLPGTLEIIEDTQPGTTVNFSILRNGQALTVPVVIEAAKPVINKR